MNIEEYVMPVRAIRRILLEEHARFFESLNVLKGIDYYRFAFSVVRSRIEACESYDELESFVRESRRMSLSDWIHSL